MASIPLVATEIRPPDVDVLGDYARVVGIRSALQGQQLQQAELQGQQLQNRQAQLTSQDDQAWRSVMSSPDWDGTPEGLLKMGMKQGVGPKSYLGMQQSILAMKQQAATLSKDQLANASAQNDAYRGKLLSIINGPDSQKASAWDNEVTQAEQAGIIKPGAMNHQYPGDDIAQTLANHFALGSTLAKEAIDQKTAAARQEQADTAKQRLAAEQDPTSPLYNPSPAAVSLGAQGGNPTMQAIQSGEAKQAGNVAGAQASVRQPYELQLAQVRQQVAQTFQNNKDAADKIEGSILKPYEDKMSQVGELQSAIQQAQQGNVTAARGVLLKLIGVTNPDGTKRYNAAEADRLLQQGSIPQRFAGSVKNLLTGNNWTDSMAQDMQSFAAAQGQVAADNLNRGIDNVNRLYGTKVGSGLKQSLPSATGATPQTHQFSISAWQRTNPGGNANAARQAAVAQGYQVVP